MIIFNLKIVNSSRLVKFFNPMFLNKQIFAIYADKFITNEKISCIDKASALYIKRVIFGCDNLFTVNCQMYNLACAGRHHRLQATNMLPLDLHVLSL